jgi:ElaB/YqjD/DUF883 family membrane-anchored ribosome-binding protein
VTTNEWWMLVGLALITGAASGGWLAARALRARHSAELRESSEELQQQFAAAVEKLRDTKARAQTELEQTRSAFKRQLAASAEEPRAATLRAEERLRAAYAEMDRMRRAGIPPDTGSAEFNDGFAATRPMREGL